MTKKHLNPIKNSMIRKPTEKLTFYFRFALLFARTHTQFLRVCFYDEISKSNHHNRSSIEIFRGEKETNPIPIEIKTTNTTLIIEKKVKSHWNEYLPKKKERAMNLLYMARSQFIIGIMRLTRNCFYNSVLLYFDIQCYSVQ